MLKKLYQKDGIIIIFNDKKNIDYCYHYIKNYQKNDNNNISKTFFINKNYEYK